LALGKWHLSSLDDQNGTGPFHRWPTGRGFDRWYGFHGNAMDHWHPEMFENTVASYPDKSEHYHLSEDLVDRGIDYIQDHIAAAPDNPFFMYLAFGACHFPLHAPSDDIYRKKGNYHEGYETIRDQRFKKQKEIGIVPIDTKLSPMNENVKAWKLLTEDEKKLAARGQEIYAAFLEHTDAQINRLVEFLKREEQYDDTIIMIISDNGAAPGSSPVPSIDTRRSAYMGPEPMSEKIDFIDAMGTDDSYGGSSVGWSQVSNTPLKWYKADTYGGGTRAPLIISWPHGDIPKNEICQQYHHAIDVLPSLLDMINMEYPSAINEKAVLPIQGVSFAYVLDSIDAPTRKKVQYFETLGDRAIWNEGWKAVSKHKKGEPFENDIWELYHVGEDFSETENLADRHPDKLKSLIGLWFEEAERYDILPMADNTMELYQKAVPPPRAKYLFYPGMTRLDRLSAPDIYQWNSRWNAEVDVNAQNEIGVIVASGDSGAGYEWFISDGYVYFHYVYTRRDVTTIKSNVRLSTGKRKLALEINKISGTKDEVKLFVDDELIGQGTLNEMWAIYVPNSGMRCGENQHAPISRLYSPPAKLQGLKRVTINVLM
jgi:arylsulfatase